jgi:hypothetical protein
MFQNIKSISCRTEADYFYVYSETGIDYEDVLNRVLECLSAKIPSYHIHLRIGVYPDVDKTLMPENWIDRAQYIQAKP